MSLRRRVAALETQQNTETTVRASGVLVLRARLDVLEADLAALTEKVEQMVKPSPKKPRRR